MKYMHSFFRMFSGIHMPRFPCGIERRKRKEPKTREYMFLHLTDTTQGTSLTQGKRAQELLVHRYRNTGHDSSGPKRNPTPLW